MNELKIRIGVVVGTTAAVFIGFTVVDKIVARKKAKLTKQENK